MTAGASAPAPRAEYDPRRPEARGRLAREFLALIGSLGLLQGARFTFSLVLAATLPLGDFTRWALFLALLTYAPALMLGAGNGMNRLVPMLHGRGLEAEAEKVESAAWTVAYGLAALLAALAVVFAVTVGPDPALAAMTIALACLYQVQQFSLRAHLRFGTASAHQAVFGSSLAVAILVTQWIALESFAGALAAYGGAQLAAVIAGAALVGSRWRAPTRSAIRRAIAEGFPIMAAGLLFGLLMTIDRWVVAAVLGDAQAAPYGLASVIAAAILLVPMVVAQQVYPRMARARGQGKDANDLMRMARTQNRYAAVSTLIPVVAIIAMASFLIPTLLPRYAAAVPPLVILVGALVVFASVAGWGNYLNVIGRQRLYLAVQGAALAAAVPVLWTGTTVAGLAGTAVGMVLVIAGYGSALRIVAARAEPARESWAQA